jgi:hypothetical protein
MRLGARSPSGRRGQGRLRCTRLNRPSDVSTRSRSRYAGALDEVEVFARSFEAYVDHLDELTPEKLETDYELMRRSVVEHANPPNLRSGAQALMVIILGEMIRRGGVAENRHDMSGYDRALRMLKRLERPLEQK